MKNQLRADCAYLRLHLAWLEAGPPECVRYEREPKKLDAALERVTKYALQALNCPLKKGVAL